MSFVSRNFVALVTAGSLASVAASSLVQVMYETHRHMERVRGTDYTSQPLLQRLGYNIPASAARIPKLIAGNSAGDEAVLNRATYAVPCPFRQNAGVTKPAPRTNPQAYAPSDL